MMCLYLLRYVSACPQAFASMVRYCVPAGAKMLRPAGAAALRRTYTDI